MSARATEGKRQTHAYREKETNSHAYSLTDSTETSQLWWATTVPFFSLACARVRIVVPRLIEKSN